MRFAANERTLGWHPSPEAPARGGICDLDVARAGAFDLVEKPASAVGAQPVAEAHPEVLLEDALEGVPLSAGLAYVFAGAAHGDQGA